MSKVGSKKNDTIVDRVFDALNNARVKCNTKHYTERNRAFKLRKR